MTEVVIVGAGPAGLAAARAARAAGARVVLLDSSDELGGQYWRHLPATRPSANEASLHHGWATFTRLRDELESDDGCRVIRSAQVWSLETARGTAGTVHVLVGQPDGTDREALTFTPDALVLATGAHDRTLPFPGWDLPGVFTAGAAQALAKGERVAIGERVLVAGAGPFLLPVAASLSHTGSTVVAVLEASRPRGLAAGWLPKPWQLIRAAKKGTELAGYVVNHLQHRIPYQTGKAVVRANGTDRVESVTIASVDANWSPIAGTETTIEVDALAVGHGFTPRLELAIAAGCALDDDRFVIVDDTQQTNVAGVFAAGEITGIGGVDLALAEGQLAGHFAAGGTGALASAHARRQRATYAVFADRIEAAHGTRPGWTEWLTAETIVCRCEEVSYGALCDAIEVTASSSLRSLKLTTRAGLGICQGRVCGRTVEELIAADEPDPASVDRRPIASPIRLSELADPHLTEPSHTNVPERTS